MARGLPVAQILVRPSQVMQGDRRLALQAGRALSLECAGVDVLRLGVVAHAIVENGDAVERGQSVERFGEPLEQRIRASQVDEAAGVVTVHAQQVAAREQALGQHVVVVCLSGDGDGLLVLRHRLGVVARGLEDRALAEQHAGAQSLALRSRQQRRGRRNLLLRSGRVALGAVITQQQPGADLQVGVRAAFEDPQCLFGVPLARFGVGAHRERAALDQRLRRIHAHRRAARHVRQWQRESERNAHHDRRRSRPAGRARSGAGSCGFGGHVPHADRDAGRSGS